MLTLKRYFAALAVLLLACGTYAMAIAPWVEPPPIRKKPASGTAIAAAASRSVQADLERLFPPGVWQRNNPKIIETEQCTLLIQDYQPTEDGGLELRPCTLIFYAAARPDPATGIATRRPIVLDAPGGAVLEFDQALDMARGEFGRLKRGELAGPIKIFSPPTHADGRDALQLTTREVQLDLEQNRIYTRYDVDFRFGESFGRGRDLTILLLPKQQALASQESTPPLGGMQSLRLAHIERLRVAAPGGGLLGDMLDRGGQEPSATTDAPLDITCRGPFVFDVTEQAASFDDDVEVIRAVPGLPVDRLRCDRLVLEFLLAGEKRTGPSSLSDDPLSGRLQRMVAEGRPTTLDAPSSGLRASARRMEYSIAKRRIALSPDGPPAPHEIVRRPRIEQVSLQQHEQHFLARELQYEMAERGRLGKLFAAGPGELRLFQGHGPARQVVTARWKDELWIRPHEENQVISLVGEASIQLEPLARFAAKEMHLWVLEVPVEPPAAAAATDTPAEPVAPPARQRYTTLPHRLLATGNVTLRSPQLDADTSRLEAWFIHRPLERGLGLERGPGLESRAREEDKASVPPLALLSSPSPLSAHGDLSAAAEQTIRPPSLQKFRAEGGLIQLQLVMQGREFDLKDLMIRDHARIDETQTEEPGDEPFHVAGELVELQHGTTPQATVVVTGHPAEVGGRGLALVGRKINVHRSENRLWIEGPGEATLPLPSGEGLTLIPGSAVSSSSASLPPLPTVVREPLPGAAGATAPPQKLHIVWLQGMSFDGLTARLVGEVQARTATQVALSQTLDATLSERIDFSSPARRQPPELARLDLAGGVFIESRGYDKLEQKTSHEQLQVPSLTVDRAAGTLHAAGPGWASTVRRSMGNMPGVPGGAVRPPAGSFASAAKRDELSSVHIAFERQIVGNLARREIQFQQRVRTTYSPAREFTDLIKAERLADLPEQGVLMTSDRLTLREMVLSPAQSWLEMEAGGNAVVEGRSFTVHAARVRYTSDKELLTIEGESRNDAQLSYETIPGQPRGRAVARRFKYWVRDEAFEGEEFSFGGLEWVGGKLKLPGLR